jgi:hypothetical protein
MHWETAEEIAARALAFLAAEHRQLARFLELTGLQPEDVRERVDTPRLLSAVLDHLAQDEPLLLAFAANARLPPEDIARASAVLQGDNRRPREP